MRRPGQKLTPEERTMALIHARSAAESPAYKYAETGSRPILPSAEEQKRLRKIRAMRSIVGMQHEYGRRKFDPDARHFIVQQAEDFASRPIEMEYGHRVKTSFMPKRLQADLEASSRLKARDTLALVDGTWFDVNHLKGRKEDGRPWFFGLGQGYDITRFLVYADSGESAIDIAENAWPRFFFSEIRSPKRVPDEEQDEWRFIESIGKLGKPEEDVRIFKQAEEVAHHATPLGDGLYRLRDGRVVEGK
jgi:hypothetical protein